MHRPTFSALALLLGVLVLPMATNAAEKLQIVAAENFYGELAREIGGDAVSVTSVLSKPDEDPHLFETSASTARAVADARIVILNGAGYDGWMEKLLSAGARTDRIEINAAQVVGARGGDNPHLWYRPETFPKVARRLAAILSRLNPEDAPAFQQRLKTVDAGFASVAGRIAAIKKRYAGTTVTATEPVFGYMCEALGLKVVNNGFQTAMMNDTEPSPSDVGAFEKSLEDGSVKLLFYNRQVADPVAKRMRAIAEANGVAVVGVSETMPAGKSIAAWLGGELDAVERALRKTKP